VGRSGAPGSVPAVETRRIWIRRVWPSLLMGERGLALVMVSPSVAILIGLVAYPLVAALYMSLTDRTIGSPSRYVGLLNFFELAKDSVFRQTLVNAVLYTVVAVTIKTVAGMGLAVALATVGERGATLRALILLPWVVPISITALAWWWMFDPMFSVINRGLRALGLSAAGIPWLGDPFWARGAVILVNVWRGLPFFATVFLAGLLSIPRELYEAAETDGAGPLQSFLRITLPLLRPVLSLVVLYSVVMTVADFEIIYILTRGGPLNRTHLFATYAFQVGLEGTLIGRGAAIALFIFPVLAVASYFTLRIIRRGEEYA
jgi:multiple sugar transport system permease protein